MDLQVFLFVRPAYLICIELKWIKSYFWGLVKLCIKCNESKKEEFDTSDTSEPASKTLYFGIE
jgi:hypothetical protein